MAAVLILLLGSFVAHAEVGAPDRAMAPVGAAAMPLHLDVTLNGRRIGKIAEFVQMPDGSLACRPAELEEIGIAAPAGSDPIPLTKLAGVTARYDAPSQAIAITVAAESTTVRKLGGREETARSELPSRADWGMAANYVFFAGASQAIGGGWSRRFDGASLMLDSRLSSPFGTLSQSAILGATTGTHADAVRLGTRSPGWTRIDPWCGGPATSSRAASPGRDPFASVAYRFRRTSR